MSIDLVDATDTAAKPAVFVSYSSRDRDIVHPLADWLLGTGIGVWLDRDQIPPGKYFGTEIVRGIRSAKVVLLMCSPHSLKSEIVFREVSLALNVQVYQMVPIWLSRVSGNPVDAYPERFQLALSHVQCLFTAGIPPSVWYPQLIGILGGLGVRPGPIPGPAAFPAYTAAVANRDWPRVVELGTALLRARPGHPNLIQGVENARGWLEHERSALLDRIRANPTPADWEAYLARFPGESLADHAKFRLAADLPLNTLGPFLIRCDRSTDAGSVVAGAIARLRLKDHSTALQTLERTRTADPMNSAAAYYLALGLVAATGLRKLILERLERVNELLQLARSLAPECGFPDLLTAFLAREYYEPRRMRSPFGKSDELFQRAMDAGLTPSDYTALSQIIS